MKKIRVFVLILLVALVPFGMYRKAWALHFLQSPGTAQSVQPSALRIVSPKPNEKIAESYVTVQYQQVSPASAAGMPTYELRLDGRDPVRTTDTSYTFNGLAPGTHDLMIQIVDANGTPILGTRSDVKFVVVNPAAGANGVAGSAPGLPPLPQPLASDLPSGNGSLPLLSIIGFGILVGGVISALRTRPAHK
ncbi:MAG TPA: hypothetical protein VG498_21520 [Terriglobales bacterium]|nr:hypothetical protein [Terriglobales bacterium]